MSKKMSYQNTDLVFKAMSEGRLLKPRGENLTTDSFSATVLMCMAHVSMQWPPTEKMKREHTPSRLYTGGWRMIADETGMLLLPSSKLLNSSEEEVESELKKRRGTAQNRVSKAWDFLKEQGLIKQLYPQSLGRNAGYLLLLGGDKENREVEEWARECLMYKGMEG